jgi:hypothetical protein
MNRYRRLALLFALLLMLIVAAANLGLGPVLFGFIYTIPYADKAGHFLLMGILSLLISIGFGADRIQFLRLLKTSLLLGALVTFEELTQIFFSNRTFSLTDLSADYAGIFLFGELGAALRKFLVIKEP